MEHDPFVDDLSVLIWFPWSFFIATVSYSYGHLLVITGYKWDYTFYKWGFLRTYNWYFVP